MRKNRKYNSLGPLFILIRPCPLVRLGGIFSKTMWHVSRVVPNVFKNIYQLNAIMVRKILKPVYPSLLILIFFLKF
jgi:hypothetical protein